MLLLPLLACAACIVSGAGNRNRATLAEHPPPCSLLGACLLCAARGLQGNLLLVVMELMPGGSLRAALQSAETRPLLRWAAGWVCHAAPRCHAELPCTALPCIALLRFKWRMLGGSCQLCSPLLDRESVSGWLHSLMPVPGLMCMQRLARGSGCCGGARLPAQRPAHTAQRPQVQVNGHEHWLALTLSARPLPWCLPLPAPTHHPACLAAGALWW